MNADRATRASLRRAVPKPVRRALWWADHGLHDAQQRAFDRWHGIETVEHANLDELGVAGAGRVFYEGIAWLPFRRALDALRPGPADVFLDLGCGKGVALVAAGRLPIARVIGVEVAPGLADAARDNLERARPHLRCREREVATADALAWPVPDDVSIVFMYCPFIGEVFDAAVARLIASHDRRPRELHLLYAYPWEHNRLLTTGRFALVDVRPAEWPPKPWWPQSGWVITTYQLTPAGEPSAKVARPWGPLRRAALRRWREPNDQRFALSRPGTERITSF